MTQEISQRKCRSSWIIKKEKGTLWGCAFFYVLHTKSAKRVCDQKTSAFSHTHLLSGTICWEGIKNLETTTKNQTKNKESKIPKNPKIQKIPEIQKIQKSKKHTSIPEPNIGLVFLDFWIFCFFLISWILGNASINQSSHLHTKVKITHEISATPSNVKNSTENQASSSFQMPLWLCKEFSVRDFVISRQSALLVA